MSDPLLRLEKVTYGFRGHPPLLKDVDLELEPGQALGLSGPSGCGKSLLARILCGLPPRGTVWSGKIHWEDQALEPGSEDGGPWQALRGAGLGLVLQDAATGLNPVLKAGDQIREAAAHHGHPLTDAELHELLAEVQLGDPPRVAGSYPHQLSGGMRQRVLLAAALACRPRLLIADEITASLDPTVQAEVLRLLDDVRRRRRMSLIFISHDPHLVRLMADHRLRFEGLGLARDRDELAGGSRPPAVPADPGEDLLVARDLRVVHEGRAGRIEAVRGVDLKIRRGEVQGLAGESGCGKSTLARALARMVPPAGGSLSLKGRDFLALGGRDLCQARRRVQVVFQDPSLSLNPRQRVQDMLSEAIDSGKASAGDLLHEVGLETGLGRRYPHMLSGGQKQRVALARALATEPEVIIADEVVSALDPEASESIMDLLTRITRQRGLGLLMISHDLELLGRHCAEVHIMLDGRIVETLPGMALPKAAHPYTRALLAAMPVALRGAWGDAKGRRD